ncbi:hypothetical protein [Entomoplasma ellychniae]|uniref:hypothetical protein n=1 Tax=Entomoplasma ellychniae TaxID=2114 RepID=UPI0015E2157C|nr:hypothetical protein [Entomoplasma ellychniae]
MVLLQFLDVVTEPSLYKINLKHLFTLIGCAIGTICGNIIMVSSNSYALKGASSIFGILIFLQEEPEKLVLQLELVVGIY